MAKKKEDSVQREKKKEFFVVDSPEQDITAIQEALRAGKVLKWPKIESFFELPEGVIREMDYESREAYFVAKSLADQAKKAPGKGYYGELEIIELIPSNMTNRFKIEAPPDVHVFFPTIEQAKAAEAAGYKYVSRKSTAFKQVIPSKTPEDGDPDKVYVYNYSTGKPEHVAMYIPKERYEKHIHSLAAWSQSRIRQADEDLEAAKREAAARARRDLGSFQDLKTVSSVSYEKEKLTQVYESEESRED